MDEPALELQDQQSYSDSDGLFNLLNYDSLEQDSWTDQSKLRYRPDPDDIEELIEICPDSTQLNFAKAHSWVK